MITIEEIYLKLLNNEELDWYFISRDKNLDEIYISEFYDKLDWEAICKYRVLSQEFILKWQKYIDWEIISQYQNLSPEFIRDNVDNIRWDYFLLNREILNDTKIKLIKELNICF